MKKRDKISNVDLIKLFIGLVFLVVTVRFIYKEDNQLLNDLQSGKKTLECTFSDGTRIVSPDKIKDVDSATDTFIFTNGYAKSCQVK